MKKYIIGFLAFALVAIGTIFAVGQKGGKENFGHHFGHRGFERIAAKLNMTDAQKEQAKQILETSRATVKPLVETMRANRQKLQALSASGQFDEAQVKVIADEQGAITAQLIVEKERAKAQLFQILNDEQKAQAKEMLNQMKERFKGKFERFGGKNF